MAEPGKPKKGPSAEVLLRQWEANKKSRVFLKLAEEYRRQGFVDSAISVLKEGLQHHAAFQPAHVALARCHVEKGQLAEAQAELERVHSKAPDNLLAGKLLAEVHEQRGQALKAIDVLKSLVPFAPDDPETSERLAALESEVAPATPTGPSPAVDTAELRSASADEAPSAETTWGDAAAADDEPPPSAPAGMPERGPLLDEDEPPTVGLEAVDDVTARAAPADLLAGRPPDVDLTGFAPGPPPGFTPVTGDEDGGGGEGGDDDADRTMDEPLAAAAADEEDSDQTVDEPFGRADEEDSDQTVDEPIELGEEEDEDNPFGAPRAPVTVRAPAGDDDEPFGSIEAPPVPRPAEPADDLLGEASAPGGGAMAGGGTPGTEEEDEFASATLAELYEDQAEFERAAEIYERLLGRHPGDADLERALKRCRARAAGEDTTARVVEDVTRAASPFKKSRWEPVRPRPASGEPAASPAPEVSPLGEPEPVAAVAPESRDEPQEPVGPSREQLESVLAELRRWVDAARAVRQ